MSEVVRVTPAGESLLGGGLRFGILGPLLVAVGDGVVEVPGARQRVLLAALLVRAGQVVPAGELAEMVWDGAPPARAAATLRSHVMRLRRVLGPVAGPRVVTRYPGYRIDAGVGEVDAAEFERLCRAGGAAARAGGWERAWVVLDEALGLWRGVPLADAGSEMLRATAVPRLEQVRVQALEWHAEAGLALGRHAELVPGLRALAGEHRLRERFCAQLMLALHRCGRQAEALEVFQAARSVLVTELGIEPGPELQRLQHAILAGDQDLMAPPAAVTTAAVAVAGHAVPREAVATPVEGGGVAGQPAGGEGVWAGCPYLGLVPFEQRHARVFYGRAEMVEQLVQRLGERLDGGGMVLVTGPSGAGKSSLLNAGLLPRLAAGVLGLGSGAWPQRVLRPTASPLRELAAQLAGLAGVDAVSVYRSLLKAPGEAPLVAGQALRAAVGDSAAAGQAGTGDGPGLPPRVVLVVDQSEELFTAGPDTPAAQAERGAFVACLDALASVPVGSHGVPAGLVVVAVRGDCLDQVLSYPPLAEAVEAGPFAVGPMSEAELRSVITGPAAEAGLAAEPALATTVIAELRGTMAGTGLGSGVLPLVSQAMAATWEHREETGLTVRAYQRAGGVADAVNRAAHAAYTSLTHRQQDVARMVFTQLTATTSDGQLTRRRCTLTDLHTGSTDPADIGAVIAAFTAARLLLRADDGVEISHDVLLSAWKQLRDWLSSDQLDHALYSQLLTDAHTWHTHSRDPAYLYRPARLATVTEATTRWAATPTHYPPLPPAAAAFLRAAHHAARRTTRRRRAVTAGLAALTLTAATTAAAAVHNAATASHQHAIALSRQLAADSLAISRTQPVTARQLAAAAWSVSPTSQAGSALMALLSGQQENGLVLVRLAGLNGVVFSPDGKLLATATSNGTVRLWNPTTRQPVGPPLRAAAKHSVLAGVAFSPNGKLLATAGYRTVRLWNLATGQPAGTPIKIASSGGTPVVAFSPDGTLLATGNNDGTIQLWNPATHQPVGAPLQNGRSSGLVTQVTFSPDGTLLATGNSDGTIQLWNPATRQPIGAPLQAGPPPPSITQVVFSPTGKLLAGTADGIIRLWNPATRQRIGAPLQAGPPLPSITQVAFSPTGKLLATAGGGLIRFWTPANGRPFGEPFQAAPHSSSLTQVVFSPNGRLLATAADGIIRFWNPATYQPTGPTLHASPQGTVNAMAFSPNGHLLATAADGIIRFWNPATYQPTGPTLRASPQGTVNAMAFSPNGRLLATAADGIIRFWNPATYQPTGPTLRASPQGTVNAMAFSPNGHLLATAADGIIRFWNPATYQPTGPTLRASPQGTVNAMAFSPNGHLLATVGGGSIRFWNPATYQPTGPTLRTTSKSALYGLAFSPNGTLLATATSDSIRLWNASTGQPIGLPLRPDTSTQVGASQVAFSPNGALLASAGRDGLVRLWKVSLFTNPYKTLCAEAGPPTPQEWRQYAPGEPQPKTCP